LKAEQPQSPNLESLQVLEYHLASKYYESDGAKIAYRGKGKWAITDGARNVANKQGGWEYEPMSSSRDDAFLERTRWDSPEAALEFWNANRYELWDKHFPNATRAD
jgi:hypothetical protein